MILRSSVTPPPDDVRGFAGIAPSRGTYPAVFDYKFDTFPEAKNLHCWLLLLWDRIIVRVAFHDPTCTCTTCTPGRSPPSSTRASAIGSTFVSRMAAI
jgi:hypothetical protein